MFALQLPRLLTLLMKSAFGCRVSGWTPSQKQRNVLNVSQGKPGIRVGTNGTSLEVCFRRSGWGSEGDNISSTFGISWSWDLRAESNRSFTRTRRALIRECTWNKSSPTSILQLVTMRLPSEFWVSSEEIGFSRVVLPVYMSRTIFSNTHPNTYHNMRGYVSRESQTFRRRYNLIKNAFESIFPPSLVVFVQSSLKVFVTMTHYSPPR